MSGTGGSGFGGGGRPDDFDCATVSIKTNVISPDPAVLVTVSVGDELEIRLRTVTGPLIAITKTGDTLGAVFTKDPSALIKCINDHFSYKATILNISGGNVQILITGV